MDLSPLTVAPTGHEDLLGGKLRLRGLISCYALFQYLTMGIKAANAVYSQARERTDELHRTLTQLSIKEEANLGTPDVPADSSHAQRHYVNRLASECEALAVQQAALLRYHNSACVFPLATLRQTLTSALAAWPTSAPLWSIYIQVSHLSRISYLNSFHSWHSISLDVCSLCCTHSVPNQSLCTDARGPSCFRWRTVTTVLAGRAAFFTL